MYKKTSAQPHRGEQVRPEWRLNMGDCEGVWVGCWYFVRICEFDRFSASGRPRQISRGLPTSALALLERLASKPLACDLACVGDACVGERREPTRRALGQRASEASRDAEQQLR